MLIDMIKITVQYNIFEFVTGVTDHEVLLILTFQCS